MLNFDDVNGRVVLQRVTDFFLWKHFLLVGGLNGALYSSPTNLNHTDWKQGTKPTNPPRTCFHPLPVATATGLIPETVMSCGRVAPDDWPGNVFYFFYFFGGGGEEEGEAAPQKPNQC